VTRVEAETFQIVTGTAFGNHDAAWIRRHLPHDGSVTLSDVTSRWACFALWGPKAGEILRPLTPDPLDFGYMRMRELAVGDVPVRALRVTFVGEVGWELYCPTEYGAGLWRALWEAGLPLEAGLDFCVREDRTFVGADALREPERRLRCLVLEDPRSVALGNEPVRVGEEICGRVTTGGYGYAVQRSIAYAYLPVEHGVGTEVHVDIFGEWVPGEVVAEPLLDPEGARLRTSP
jgi:glycine cleavage system aminomethyltransferase T